MRIPMVDLGRQYRSLRDPIHEALDAVLESSRFIQGPEVAELEERIKDYLGAGDAVACASGTDALELAMWSLDLSPGDEVIVPAFTFIASAESISTAGARPVFADVSPDTLNLDPADVERRITPRTKAIMAVHLFGQCADLGALGEICRKRGLTLIEDAAQAIGADFRGRMAGSIGRLGTLSFFPSKNLGGYGDGGMILCESRDTGKRLRAARNHGQRERYAYDFLGRNSRLDTLQAAILLVKLDHLESWIDARRRVAARYRELLTGAPVEPLAHDAFGRHVYHQFTVRVPDGGREAVQAALAERGIASAVYYPSPLSRERAFAHLGKPADLPVSERASRQVLSLPIFPELLEEEVVEVAETVLAALPEGAGL